MENISIKTSFIGQNCIFLPECRSTNTYVKESLADKDRIHGTVVFTPNQTAGRGQFGNVWESEKDKNLALSIVLNPSFLEIQEQFNLSIAVSISIYEFLCQYIRSPLLKIKWPNDIFYKDKKICGILIENILKNKHIENSIVGVGININQEKFDNSKAISLKNITQKDYSLEKLLGSLLEFVEKNYLLLEKKQENYLKFLYLSNLYRYKQTHTYQSNTIFEGQIVDIDKFGRLVLDTAGGRRSFDFKTIKYL